MVTYPPAASQPGFKYLNKSTSWKMWRWWKSRSFCTNLPDLYSG